MKPIDIVIIIIVVVVLANGVYRTWLQLSGKKTCCGGSKQKIKIKKLKNIIGVKVVHIDGMHCDHCKASVTKAINSFDKAYGKVNLGKNTAHIYYQEEISDQEIIKVIEDRGFIVKMIEKEKYDVNKTKKAYRKTKRIYDDLLTGKSILGKLYLSFFWKGTDDNEIAQKVLSYIPNDFSGTLLDVPVGTAVFTAEKWKKLNKANIICLDYSEEMLDMAKERLIDYSHISCIQGDVSNLDLENNSCDIVISMNGIHVFVDKIKAYAEIDRVLKPNGKFIACFYVKGENRKSDWLVNHFLAKKGWFSPPFQTFEELKSDLLVKYNNINIDLNGSFVYFCCQKKEYTGGN